MISVCLATFNGEKYIKEQLLSILNQLNENDEVIISDDCSTDKTISIIKDLNDSRVKIFINKNNKKSVTIYKSIYSVNRNFSNALEKASGDIIFLSDQDDIWIKDKVKLMINELKKYDLVISNCLMLDDNNVSKESYFDIVKPNGNFYRTFYKSSYHGCCMAFKRSVLSKAMPLPNTFIGHDTWIGLVSSRYFSVKFLDKPLLLYRRHGDTVTTASGKSSNSLLSKIIYRLNLILHSILRLRK
ncbi:hypothetical protein VT25_03875 [Photobacterium leiognathi subsp. mandapamensis]|nr:hypothetical protein VT25_03875 [Photobacterium leiognathi subsp. mandapamensis]